MNISSITNEELLLTKKQVADRLSVSPRTVENFTNRGLLPKVCLGSKTVRYPASSIEQIIQENTVNLNSTN